MTESYRYDVEVLHLLVSPAHAYFGRAREGAADVPTTDAGRVELVAGKGIVGDRFAAELGTAPLDPLLTRRNIVLRGAHLAPLLGHDFALESQGELVRLTAGRPAHPCVWMDEMLAPGAHKAMRGRGGVRCRAVSDGVLHRGPAVLVSPVPLEPERASEATVLRASRLP